MKLPEFRDSSHYKRLMKNAKAFDKSHKYLLRVLAGKEQRAAASEISPGPRAARVASGVAGPASSRTRPGSSIALGRPRRRPPGHYSRLFARSRASRPRAQIFCNSSATSKRRWGDSSSSITIAIARASTRAPAR